MSGRDGGSVQTCGRDGPENWPETVCCRDKEQELRRQGLFHWLYVALRFYQPETETETREDDGTTN